MEARGSVKVNGKDNGTVGHHAGNESVISGRRLQII